MENLKGLSIKQSLFQVDYDTYLSLTDSQMFYCNLLVSKNHEVEPTPYKPTNALFQFLGPPF